LDLVRFSISSPPKTHSPSRSIPPIRPLIKVVTTWLHLASSRGLRLGSRRIDNSITTWSSLSWPPVAGSINLPHLLRHIALAGATKPCEPRSSREIGRYSPLRPDCVAGHLGLELRNVDANYPFESSRGFPGSEPNSGQGDHSRLSCSGGDTQLGAGFCRDLQQAFCTDVGHHAASPLLCHAQRAGRAGVT